MYIWRKQYQLQFEIWKIDKTKHNTEMRNEFKVAVQFWNLNIQRIRNSLKSKMWNNKIQFKNKSLSIIAKTLTNGIPWTFTSKDITRKHSNASYFLSLIQNRQFSPPIKACCWNKRSRMINPKKRNSYYCINTFTIKLFLICFN